MLKTSQEGHIFRISLQTNEKNTMDKPLFLELKKILTQVKADPSVKCLILDSANESFFSNGFEPTIFLDKPLSEIEDILDHAIEASSEFLMFPKPTVNAITGHSMGIGAVFSIFADYRIMVDKRARIGFPESLIGLNFPSGAGYILKELVGLRNARDLLIWGKGIKGPEALEMGLVDVVCSPEEIEKELQKLCSRFGEMAMGSVTGIKASIRDYMFPVLDSIKNDVKNLAKTVHSPDGQEGMRSILEKRRPIFQ